MPRITFQEWASLTQKQRRRYLRVLDESDDEESPDAGLLFSAIAPPLRVADFETSVDNWEQAQANFDQLGASRATWSSSSSRTSLVGDVLARIDDLRTQQQQVATTQQQQLQQVANAQQQQLQQVSDRLANLELVHRTTATELETVRQSQEESAFLERAHIPMYDLIRISGQAALMRDILQPFASVDLPPLPILLSYNDNEQFERNQLTYFSEDPDYDSPTNQARAYEVFQVIDDFEHTLQRYFIQPRSEREIVSYGTGFNHYRQAIQHFIDRNQSPISHLMDAGATLSVTFHCLIDGVERNHTFREYPGSEKSLQDYITMVYTEDGGSDKIFKRLRTNIVAVSVTVVNPYSGGARVDSKKAPWFKCFDYMASARKHTNENSCLYACVRYVWKITSRQTMIKQNRYALMRRKLTGHENDIPVPTTVLSLLNPTFGIDVIVLGSALPRITIGKPCKTQNGYFDLDRPYTIEYDTIFFQPAPGGSLVESSDNLLSFNSTDRACFVTLEGKQYFLLCLQNNHYSVVTTIFRPTVCNKCGSMKHTTKQAMDNDRDRLDCLESLRDVLTDDQLKKATPNIATVVFDFETVVFKGILIPYSVSWCVIDCLTHIPGPVRNHIGPHAASFFLNSLRYNTPGIKTLVGYNSSRFDNYLVMHQLLLDGAPLDSTNSTVFNNQILKISSKEFRTWDICQFTKCSLSQAAEAYRLQQGKLEFDHRYVQNLFDQHGWAFIDKIGRDVISEYNNQDVLLTAQLFNIVVPSLKTITGIDPLSCMTLSQLAFKHMTQFNVTKNITLTQVPLTYDHIFDTVPAGRVQMFVERGIFEGDFVQVDANGLYQYIALEYTMSDGQPSFYSTFQEFEESSVQYRDLFLTECSVDQSSLRIKLVGQKQEDECIDWTLDFVQSCWLWREEIEMLESLGCPVTKGSVLVWPKPVKPFEVMNVYKDIRLREKKEGRDGGVIDLQAKLCSNAITGKCYQRNRTEEWAVVGSLPECEKFKETHRNVTFDTTDLPRKYYIYGDSNRLLDKEFIDKPRHMGARIYAMARLYMFSIIKDLKTIKYMDTDGFIMSRTEKEATPALIHSVQLGGFKIEADGDRVYLCSLKNYALIKTTAEKTCLEAPHLLKADKKKCEKDGFYHNKYRLKGYHNDDPWKSEKGTYNGTFVNEDIYKALIDGKVTTKTEKIVKRFVHQGTSGTYSLSTLISQSQDRIVA